MADRLPAKEVTKRPVGVCKCVYISMCVGVRVCPCVSANAFFLVHVQVLGALETDNGGKTTLKRNATTNNKKNQTAGGRVYVSIYAVFLVHVNFGAQQKIYQ